MTLEYLDCHDILPQGDQNQTFLEMELREGEQAEELAATNSPLDNSLDQLNSAF